MSILNLLNKFPASAKTKILKQFVPMMGEIIASGYVDKDGTPLQLQEGETDFSTLLFEDNRGHEDSRVLAQVCTIDGAGSVVRCKLRIYDLMAVVSGLKIEDKPESELPNQE